MRLAQHSITGPGPPSPRLPRPPPLPPPPPPTHSCLRTREGGARGARAGGRAGGGGGAGMAPPAFDGAGRRPGVAAWRLAGGAAAPVDRLEGRLDSGGGGGQGAGWG